MPSVGVGGASPTYWNASQVKSAALQVPAGSLWQFISLAGTIATKLAPPFVEQHPLLCCYQHHCWCGVQEFQPCPVRAIRRPVSSVESIHQRAFRWALHGSDTVGRNGGVKAGKGTPILLFFRHDMDQTNSDSPMDWKASALLKIKRGGRKGQIPTKRMCQVAALSYSFVAAGSQERRADGDFWGGNSLQMAWEVPGGQSWPPLLLSIAGVWLARGWESTAIFIPFAVGIDYLRSCSSEGAMNSPFTLTAAGGMWLTRYAAVVMETTSQAILNWEELEKAGEKYWVA